ncbi:MAG TPA: TolC family protein [Chitinophagaceae bacterium]|jgi:outer membrane protein TolC|nr:TolC family protein [Chitinophagaceae bacterium]
MKLRNKVGGFIISLGVVASVSVQAQDSAIHRLSAQQAVDYAVKNNVQVKNALLDVQIQKQTNKEITAAAYPQIKGSGSFTYNAKIPVTLIPGDFFGQPGTFVPLKFGVKYNATGGISLDQLLFDGQVFVGLQARQTSIDFQQKNVEVTEELIKANIYKIYYQLVASKTQIELLDANIARLEKLLNDTREIFKNGFAEKIDVDKVSVQLANVQTEKVKVLNQIDNGYLGLKVLMGMPIKDSLMLTDEITYDRVREGLLDGNAFQYNDRKEYQYAELGIKLYQFNIKRYKLSRIPTLSLSGYYNKNAQRNEFDFFKGDRQWYSFSAFTLRLDIPIFQGFSTRAKIDGAKLQLQKSINQRESLKLSIDNEIEIAKNNFRSAIATLDFQKKNMELAETVYNQTKKKYEAGTGSQIEISNAQTDLKTAQTNYISALYDAIIARVDYLKAIGKL